MENERISELIRIIKTKPEIFIKNDTNKYSSYMYFFETLFIGIELCMEIKMERLISSWYTKNIEIKPSNISWFYFFEKQNQDLSETDKIKLLLDTMDDFFSNYLQ